MNTDYKEIGDRGAWLRERIEEAGYTYKLISELIGLDKSTIFRWTRIANLDFTKMKLIADAIQLDLRKYFADLEKLYASREVDYKELYEREVENSHLLKESIAHYKTLLGQKRDNEDWK